MDSQRPLAEERESGHVFVAGAGGLRRPSYTSLETAGNGPEQINEVFGNWIISCSSIVLINYSLHRGKTSQSNFVLSGGPFVHDQQL